MSVTKQEAEFLKSILAKHLDDYVEELVRADRSAQAMKHMQENRQAGLDLISKVEETIRRAARAGNDTYFTCLLYTSPSPRDGLLSRMPSSA